MNTATKSTKMYKGEIALWDDMCGYGFITHAGAKDKKIFFHISAYQGNSRPREGEMVFFSFIKEGDKLKAPTVKPQFMLSDDPAYAPQQNKTRQTKQASSKRQVDFRANLWIKLLISLVVGPVWFYALYQYVPVLFQVYGVLSIVLLLLYLLDKRAAVKGNWRTSETKLHLFALLGGWVGGLLGRYVFNHKTTKSQFVWLFWITVLINIGLTYYIVFIDTAPIRWLESVWSQLMKWRT